MNMFLLAAMLSKSTFHTSRSMNRYSKKPIKGVECLLLAVFLVVIGVGDAGTFDRKEAREASLNMAHTLVESGFASRPAHMAFPQAFEQIENVNLALTRAGIFVSMAKAMKDLDITALPQNATLFVPSDRSIQGTKVMHNLTSLQYHMVTKQLPFAQMLRLKLDHRLPTNLPGFSIVVTSVHPENFTIDEAKIFWPDLYKDQTLVAHGIDGVLDPSVYGTAMRNKPLSSPFLPSFSPSASPSSPRPKPLPKKIPRRPAPLAGSSALVPTNSLTLQPLPPTGSPPRSRSVHRITQKETPATTGFIPVSPADLGLPPVPQVPSSANSSSDTFPVPFIAEVPSPDQQLTDNSAVSIARRGALVYMPAVVSVVSTALAISIARSF